jgi:hypothetical protein
MDEPEKRHGFSGSSNVSDNFLQKKAELASTPGKRRFFPFKTTVTPPSCLLQRRTIRPPYKMKS